MFMYKNGRGRNCGLFGSSSQVTTETQEKIDEEIDRIQNSNRNVDVDEGQVAAADLARETRVDDGNERSIIGDETEPLTISTANAYAGDDAIDEDAQINIETDGEEIEGEETEKETKEQELQPTIAQLREELVKNVELIAEKEKDLASTKAILRKIGMMANSNSKDDASNHDDGKPPHSRDHSRDPSGGAGDEEAKHKQQRLFLLLHTSKCSGECKTTPHCAEFKKLWKHMARCTDNKCTTRHCFSSRKILTHYRHCKGPCTICDPVRDFAQQQPGQPMAQPPIQYRPTTQQQEGQRAPQPNINIRQPGVMHCYHLFPFAAPLLAMVPLQYHPMQMSLQTSRKRAANLKDVNEPGSQHAATRPRLQEFQFSKAQPRMKNEEMQKQVVSKLQSTIAQLREELVEQYQLVAEKDRDLASMKAILRNIVMMSNSKDEDANYEDVEPLQSRYRGTESGDRNQREKELQSQIDSLKVQLKNSRPIETVDLTKAVEPSTATEDDSNGEEPPLKRRRMKSNLAVALEQTQQMVSVKEEAIQRATSAEASAQAARREKDSVEASLRDVQEDLEIQQETTEQVNLTLDTWQGRFDRVYELAAAAGVDAAVLKSIREGNNN